jgi:hypothetical protein
MEYKIIYRSEKNILKDISEIPKQNLKLIFDKLESLYDL